MKWFDGSIPEAIQTSKQKGVIFLVYIYGNDEMSDQMNQAWDSEEVTHTCDSNDLVAIRLLNTSTYVKVTGEMGFMAFLAGLAPDPTAACDDCKFFSQIYPILCVPSTFCIGDGGVPQEVIGGHLKVDEFHAKLQKTVDTYKQQKRQESTTLPPTSSPGEGNSQVPPVLTTTTTNSREPPVPTTTTKEAPPMPSAGTDNSDTDMPPVASTSVADTEASGDKIPLDDKIEKAKQLVEHNREVKAKQEQEKQRVEEVKRRATGHDLHKLKQQQADAEMREVRQQLRRDKEDDRQAREKIKAQIAKDRVERQVRSNKDVSERERAHQEVKRARLEEQQKAAAHEEAVRSATARIQVRLPDGSSVTRTYESSDPLQLLHDDVAQRLGGAVTLSTTFPRQTFTQEDMHRTFTDLQLAPSAVVMAVRVVKSNRRRTQTAVSSTSLLQTLFSPILMLWNFIYTLLYGSATPTDRSDRSATQSASRGQPETSAHQTRAYQRRGPDSQPQGNMRRMTDIRGDDDDMTTYNGNSTQQM